MHGSCRTADGDAGCTSSTLRSSHAALHALRAVGDPCLPRGQRRCLRRLEVGDRPALIRLRRRASPSFEGCEGVAPSATLAGLSRGAALGKEPGDRGFQDLPEGTHSAVLIHVRAEFLPGSGPFAVGPGQGGLADLSSTVLRGNAPRSRADREPRSSREEGHRSTQSLKAETSIPSGSTVIRHGGLYDSLILIRVILEFPRFVKENITL